MDQTAKILANAVVQMPERRFPGTVVQGDTFASWVRTIQEVLEHVGEASHDTYDDLEHMLGDMRRYQEHYEAVLEKAGIPLPYVRQAAGKGNLKGAAE